MDASLAIDCACRMMLGARIAARYPESRLEVELGDSGWRSLHEDILANQFTRSVDSTIGPVIVLNDVIHVAHTLHHLLAQHHFHEQLPILIGRLLADIADLGWCDSEWERFEREGYPLIASDLPLEDVRAIRSLVRKLTRGTDPVEIEAEESPESILLRYWLAGTFSADYRKAASPKPSLSLSIGNALKRTQDPSSPASLHQDPLDRLRGFMRLMSLSTVRKGINFAHRS